MTFTFAILGAGGRVNYFSQLIERNPRAGNVVAVADPDPARRKLIADRHQIPQAMQFEKWEDLLARPKLADCVINTLMDRLHAPSAT